MTLTTEQIQARRDWIAALRSGEYKQTKGNLKDSNSYCCLGVACEVLGIESRPISIDPPSETGVWSFGEQGDTAGLPREAQALLGYEDTLPYIAGVDQLHYMNDTLHFSFNEIADELEAELDQIIADQNV